MKFKLFSPKTRAGLYNYRAEGELKGLRLQLRVEDDGTSMLIVNASRVLFLNRTATEYIFQFMHDKSDEFDPWT